MDKAILKKRLLLPNVTFGTGAFPDPRDDRDFVYDDIALGAAPVDWAKGYDVEKELNIKLPLKNQGQSSSCVGQAWSYYVGVVNAKEVGRYDELSAKAFYSQFFLPQGGAYLRDGGKLAVNWGAIMEMLVTSYQNSNPPSESFMTDKSWKTPQLDSLAKVLQAKEYRTIDAETNMELFAAAIRDNLGVVGGVYGINNGTWSSFEPTPPGQTSPGKWGHALYFGKFGVDSLGKYIATPNSWGTRGAGDALHPDGWQKLRENYFLSKNMFSPWTLTDKPNIGSSPEGEAFAANNEKKLIIEAEGAGRKGIVVDGKVRIIPKDRVAEACLYKIAVDGGGKFIATKLFDEMPKGDNF